jgi:NAD-dependent deacetylase
MSSAADSLIAVAQRLRSARKVFVITGAGISAESGVPTFRGAGGHWRNFRAEDLASPEGFARDPAMVWEWYNDRRRNLLDVQPNPGHLAIAALEQRIPHFLLATQNVDGLHQEAGSRHIETIHGDIWTTRCLGCGEERRERRRIFDQFPPACDRCGGMLRPAVVWFGEMLPTEPLERIAAFLSDAPPVDVTLLIGTTALFGYIQSWALGTQGQGALIVEVNPESTVLSDSADVCLRGPSGEVLPRLLGEADLG